MKILLLPLVASGLETFSDVASSGGLVTTRILFESRVAIGTARTYRGGTFAGASGLFDVVATRLGLENLRLENCGESCITAADESVVNFTNVVAVNCTGDRGGVVYLKRESSLILISSLFVGNSAVDHGGVVSMKDSTMDIRDSTFKENSAGKNGGAIEFLRSDLKITTSKFTENTAENRAGGIYASGGSLTLSESSFTANVAANLGGVLWVKDADIRVANASFLRNGAADGGVAFFSNEGHLQATNVSFVENSAFVGGVFDCNTGVFDVENALFRGNSAGDTGGVARFKKSTFEARNSLFDANEARSTGVFFLQEASKLFLLTSVFRRNKATEKEDKYGEAGVAEVINSNVTVDRCSFFENTCQDDGGVFFVVTGTLDMKNSQFENNFAGLEGGVAKTMYGSNVTVLDCEFRNNSAAEKGGVFYLQLSDVQLKSSQFSENSCAKDGGVFFAESGILEMTNSRFSRNNAVSEGGVGRTKEDTKVTIFECDFRNNAADEGGVFWFRRSDITLTSSNFIENYAETQAGIAQVNFQTRVFMTNCTWIGNQGGKSAGGVHIWSTSFFLATTSTFIDNYAVQGGVVDLCSTSSLSITNSSFQGNHAWDHGHLIYVTGAAQFELDSSEILGDDFQYNPVLLTSQSPLRLRERLPDANASAVRCEGTGTTYASKLTMQLTANFFSMATNCVLFLYFTNNNGSQAYRSAVEAENVVDFGSASVNFIHWSYPCGPGQWSFDGMEHGEKKDGNNRTIDENDQFCDDDPETRGVLACAERCETCPAGKYLPGGLNPYLHLGSGSCRDCPVGRELTDDGLTSGRWWLHDDVDDCTLCPPGRFASEPGSPACSDCADGTYANLDGSISCSFVNPGFFVKDAASVPAECPPGTFSIGGTGACQRCDIGEFNPDWCQSSCRACPSPMTTTGTGKVYCDACIPSYFWNSLQWKSFDDETSQCVDCCDRCEDICDMDNRKKCVDCDKNETMGGNLTTLDVTRGWWRATKESLTVYKCRLNRACRGGPSTASREQCFHGHRGALCGACRKRYDYQITSNRCVRCTKFEDMLSRGAVLFMLMIFIFSLFGFVISRLSRRHFMVLTAAFLMMKDHVKGDAAHDLDDHLDGMAEDSDDSDDEHKREYEEKRPKSVRRRSLRRSIFTKLKIVIAASQIASSTDTVFWKVKFPPLFAKVTHLFNFLGFSFFDVGSFKCLFGWSYYEKLVFVTLAPVGAVPLAAVTYWIIQKSCGKLKSEAEKRKFKSMVTYASLLFLFIVLPSISTYVITYFSCVRFDRGNQRDLRVVATELSIDCTSRKYQFWALYDAIMIAVWPVGATLGTAVLLWRNRRKLNPVLPPPTPNSPRRLENEKEGFEREQRRHTKKMAEISKLELRSRDRTIDGLEFLFEDYEPRCYLFPVFEIGRRLFLSAVLAVFFPGSIQQVVVGLLGSMLSFLVYIYFDAFIEDEDDIVAAVAQGELVLIYFAAMAVYTSDVADKKQAAFSGTAFGALLVIVFFASFIVACYAICLDLFGIDGTYAVYEHISSRSRRLSTSLLSIISPSISIGLGRRSSHSTDDDENPSPTDPYGNVRELEDSITIDDGIRDLADDDDDDDVPDIMPETTTKELETLWNATSSSPVKPKRPLSRGELSAEV